MSLDPQAAAPFDGGNYVHLATLRADGSPQSRPALDDRGRPQRRLLHAGSESEGTRLARDPRVALSVVDYRTPYRDAWMRGRVERTIAGDDALAVIDRISHAYTGEPFPVRSGVVFVVAAEASGYGELPFVHAPSS